ncbi:cobalt ECF transporter T component CbiQ [Candidatus Bathyarchaeota archaeon]|nr:cobalt ECF transporter T component CbiQ [Candidatus Bathyarchaeota archaeon]
MSLLKAFEDIVYAEKFQALSGLLQGIDPRVKFCSLVSLLVVAVGVRTITPLVILFVTITVFAVVSKIPLKYFFLRATLFIPIFAAVIALPLPFITPGTTLTVIGYNEYVIYITREGVYRALQFVFRIWVCVGLLVLLMSTTRFTAIIRALETFKIPRVFVMMTGVTHRFIFLFINEAYRMLLAKEARNVGREQRMQVMKSLAYIIGTLFIRAYERSERVYLAMMAKAYTGEARSMGKMRCSWRDWVFGVASCFICIIVVLIEFLNVGGI